jgi:hypothetical protein
LTLTIDLALWCVHCAGRRWLMATANYNGA